MQAIEQVLYTGKVTTSGGGRDGVSRSDDGRLDVALSSFTSGGQGTNPEQLLGAGWSSCYIGALHLAAAERKLRMPEGARVNAEVDLGKTGSEYYLQARLEVHIPGLPLEVVEELAERAHATCPYSKALTKSIGVTTRVV
ncbi:peroxiredoxin [Massilia sp. KIM]|uniref:Ohr family peroxiredoxin n=1 Tax=Massilia sp. KIM TaxID=1955422 RepID=UPI00098E8A16|nr:Ohr family peroxiredoxin [Massilia sp. KIM]OON62759.1 peroxiredoxin [Massilia sp. KIM]